MTKLIMFAAIAGFTFVTAGYGQQMDTLKNGAASGRLQQDAAAKPTQTSSPNERGGRRPPDAAQKNGKPRDMALDSSQAATLSADDVLAKARRAARQIEQKSDDTDREDVLRALAVTQAKAGNFEAALQTARSSGSTPASSRLPAACG